MTRAKIDLSGHKLAGLYRAPPRASKRNALRKGGGDAVRRQLWRLVDGAVRDAFACHPEYLTPLGQIKAVQAINKRVTGALHGYAAQAAQGRSAPSADVTMNAAADTAGPRFSMVQSEGKSSWDLLSRMHAAVPCILGWFGKEASPKFTGGQDV